MFGWIGSGVLQSVALSWLVLNSAPKSAFLPVVRNTIRDTGRYLAVASLDGSSG